MQELISIIVPVYNTAAYLEDCIRSVLAQSWPHFELLLMDDGSQDESPSICLTFCEKDPRIRFLQQAHKGASAARNRAMQEARGDYFFFLDSDDAIHPRLLQVLLQLAKEHGAAVAQTDGQRVSSEELQNLLQAADTAIAQKYSGLYLENEKALKQVSHGDPITPFFHAIGGKLIKCETALLCSFDEGMKNGEDTKFVYRLFASGADAVILKQKWYYYRSHERSASSQRSRAAYLDRYAARKYICEQEKNNGRLENAASCADALIYILLIWYQLSKEDEDSDLTEYLKELAAAEKKSWRFPLISPCCKGLFYLILYCYPLYRGISFFLLPLQKKWKERRQKRI